MENQNMADSEVLLESVEEIEVEKIDEEMGEAFKKQEWEIKKEKSKLSGVENYCESDGCCQDACMQENEGLKDISVTNDQNCHVEEQNETKRISNKEKKKENESNGILPEKDPPIHNYSRNYVPPNIAHARKSTDDKYFVSENEENIKSNEVETPSDHTPFENLLSSHNPSITHSSSPGHHSFIFPSNNSPSLYPALDFFHPYHSHHFTESLIRMRHKQMLVLLFQIFFYKFYYD